jgi:hypothetical protein
MCWNETYSKVCKGKYLSYNFPIQNGLKQRDALSPPIFNFALEQIKHSNSQPTFYVYILHMFFHYIF